MTMLIEVRSWHEVDTPADEQDGRRALTTVMAAYETLASFAAAHPPRKVQLRTFVGDERSDHVLNPPEWTAASDQGAQ